MKLATHSRRGNQNTPHPSSAPSAEDCGPSCFHYNLVLSPQPSLLYEGREAHAPVVPPSFAAQLARPRLRCNGRARRRLGYQRETKTQEPPVQIVAIFGSRY